MGIYKYIRQAWNKPKEAMRENYKNYLIKWRREPVTLRVDRPTRLDRARSLGYRAKQGIFVVRQRVSKGLHRQPARSGGRRSKRFSSRINLQLNYQSIAERRANKVFQNCEVLNSYLVGRDGRKLWYEVIMVDKAHPAILKDKKLKWTAFPQNRKRVFRGKTSSQRKTRGLRNKGKGAEKVRPSKRANKK